MFGSRLPGSATRCALHLIIAATALGLLPPLPALASTSEERGGPHRVAGHQHHRQGTSTEQEPKELALTNINVPDVPLVDQEGREVRFYSDLVKGRLVVINTIFTTCTTICPPMGANFANLQKRLGDRTGREVHLISVSVDPVVDTPERLKAWAARFGAGPGWTLVTGRKRDIDGLLKGLKVFTPLPEDHSPILLVGNDASGEWTRIYGLAPPAEVVEVLGRLAPPAPSREAGERSAAARYFTDIVLVNQNGEERRLYTDLLEGRSVIINTFFTSCGGSCPVIMARMKSIQSWLGDRLGRDAFILSLTVDPETDTAERLQAYASGLEARKGWELLTGEPERLAEALRKLGQYVESPENHSNVLIVGNEPTGLWKKALVLASTEELLEVVDSVLRDRGASSSP